MFDKTDVGSWLVIHGGKWYERLGAAIVTRVRYPRLLNHVLYFIYNKVLANRSSGVFKVVSVDSTCQVTLDTTGRLTTAARSHQRGTFDER